VDDFGFVQAIDGFGQCVVVDIATLADRVDGAHTLQLVESFAFLAAQAWSLAVIDLCKPKHLGSNAQLACDRRHCRPLGRVLPAVLLHHAHRPLPQLLRVPARSAYRRCILSKNRSLHQTQGNSHRAVQLASSKDSGSCSGPAMMLLES
jgi:hypothetical protein